MFYTILVICFLFYPINEGGLNMKRLITSLLTLLLLFSLTGCSSPKTPDADEPNPPESKPEITVSTDLVKSATLPKTYPEEKYPIYEDSFILTVIELDGGFTLTAFSKEDVKKVIAFYVETLKGAKVDMETKTDESLTSFGSKDGYTFNIDIGKSSEQPGYTTSIILMLMPTK
jgi:predicted small lipoprotein YifL